MDNVIGPDGSIQTQAKQLLTEIRVEFEKLEERSSTIEKDSERLSEFMASVRWLITILGSLIFAVAFFVGWAGFSSLNNIKKEISEIVPVLVSKEISENLEARGNIKNLRDDFVGIKAEYDSYREYVEGLSVVVDAGDHALKDPHFAYLELEKIEFAENDETSVGPDEEKRRIALTFLHKIIEAGTERRVDPNTLFNAGIVASRLSMEQESLKLATLAAYWLPSISHLANLHQKRDLFGVEYQFDGSQFSTPSKSADEVRREAWASLIKMIETAPREEAEQVYSKASNVAVRNRSAGYYSHLIDAIEKSHELRAPDLSSYAYVTLADQYVYRGGQSWEENYKKAITLAFEKLRSESPLSSWYEHSIRSAIKTAVQINKLEEIVDLGSRKGIDLLSGIR